MAVSLAAHAALFAAWLSTRPEPQPAESPIFQVQLVRPPPSATPQPRPQVRPPPSQPPGRPSRPVNRHEPPPLALPPGPTAQTPVEISPQWRVKPGAYGADLDAAPFVLGRPGLKRAREPKPDCKTHGWDRPLSCPPDATELAASKGLAERDSSRSGFAYEASRKAAIKAYKDTIPGEYPGLRCTVLHTHC
jgi:hypothetical protein